jgi:hypothetical protein
MKPGTEQILSTHTGSFARPPRPGSAVPGGEERPGIRPGGLCHVSTRRRRRGRPEAARGRRRYRERRRVRKAELPALRRGAPQRVRVSTAV